MIRKILRKPFIVESGGGILLLLSTIAALVLANIPGGYGSYIRLLSISFDFSFGIFHLEKSLYHLINDGLMTIFFFQVALEIKRERKDGELASREQIALPLIAAIGGIVVPAVLYVLVNWNNSVGLRGWAVSSATDIAFAVGILSLLGSRIPSILRTFLLTLAILDDLASIIIIAVFYTSEISMQMLALAGLGILILAILNAFGCRFLWAYLITGFFLWYVVLKSGVHATLSGVVLGFFIPFKLRDGKGKTFKLLTEVEHSLNPWVTYGILPIFAFANAGISFAEVSRFDLLSPVTLGIFFGLLIGKPLGIGIASLISIKLKLSKLPSSVPFYAFIGLACLGGIGFTMSFFIASLAFVKLPPQYMTYTKLGVLGGSLISGILGYLILRSLPEKKELL
ncbi:MAG: Na+/H+ antiporter NhaA [SAR324 cluster bacterium]|uniref:Na(+)/H(+) antiporter NhaA n=1 Tax=SAR324 cluster bacterium TaxID=2024889 RepID=A0A7X9IK42_9DELT|nr:Na+/H+ antiporter NhaA [SAR324 cluster bacterium]